MIEVLPKYQKGLVKSQHLKTENGKTTKKLSVPSQIPDPES